MDVYSIPSKEEMAIVKKYKKLGETVKVSDWVLLNGKKYKEVMFTKNFQNFRQNPFEYIYLDEQNNILDNKNIIEKVGRLVFFMEAFYSDGEKSIMAAFHKEGDLEKDRDDLKSCLEGISVLKNRKESDDANREKNAAKKKIIAYRSDLDYVEGIITKLDKQREVANVKIKELIEKIDAAKEKNEIFNEAVIEEVMPCYREVMFNNYEKIKLIASGERFYPIVKEKSENVRRANSLKLNTRHSKGLMQLHYTMGYFDNLLRAYSRILSMSGNEYMKQVNNSGRVNAENKMFNLKNKI